MTIRRAFPAPVVQPFFIVLVPGHKVFCRRSTSAVKHLIRINRQNQLCVTEQLRNVFFTPVSDVLVDTFHHIHTGFFTFDDHQRDTIDQHYDIRTSEFTIRTFYFKLIRHLECIIFRVFKVNETQIKGLTGSVRQILFHAFARTEKLIDRLVFSIQSGCTELVYSLHRLSNGAS